jgi:hypothetical protein
MSDKTLPALPPPLSAMQLKPAADGFVLLDRAGYETAARVFEYKWHSRRKENDDAGKINREMEMTSFHNWIVCLTKLQNFKEAEVRCQHIRANRADYYWVDFLLAACEYLRGGDPIEAEKHYEHAKTVACLHKERLRSSLPATSAFEALIMVRTLHPVNCLVLRNDFSGLSNMRKVEDYRQVQWFERLAIPIIEDCVIGGFV